MTRYNPLAAAARSIGNTLSARPCAYGSFSLRTRSVGEIRKQGCAMEPNFKRRQMFSGAVLAASGLMLGSARGYAREQKKEDVGAVEDLMREHGVIRRAILVYRNSARELRAGKKLDPQALRRTANLMRTFGEDYHERKLEEAHIFPAVKKAGGSAAGYVDVLLAQHRRGREITDYVLDSASKGRVGGDPGPMAAALEGFELMYAHHTAREDTIVFPAWKKTMSEKQLDEMGEKFEDIERQQFGKDGFDDAVEQISEIETALGMADIAQFTAASPKT
jgi:hemerythrin-like domain-containing protein